MKRAFLTGLGITDGDVIKQIIDYHQGVVTDMKDDIASAKAEVKTAQDELKKAQAAKPEPEPIKVEDTEEYKALKVKYDTDITAKTTEFDTFKQGIEAEKTTSTVTAALKKALLAGKDGKSFSAKALDENENPLFVEMFNEKIKSFVPNAKIGKDGNITNIDDLVKPFIDGMKGFIGEPTTTAAVADNVATGTGADGDPFLKGFDNKL